MPDSKYLWVVEEIPHLVQLAFVARFGHNQQRRIPINVQFLARVAAARPRILATW